MALVSVQRRKMIQNKRGFLVGVCVLICLSLAGCAAESRFQGGNLNSNKLKSLEKGSTPLYYDFSDVLVPGELKMEREASFIYQTAGFSAGVLAFSGNVESNSLVTFFTENMVKDNWKEIGSIRSVRTLMLFTKPGKWCAITISKKDLFSTNFEISTNIEIWVAPIVDGHEASISQ